MFSVGDGVDQLESSYDMVGRVNWYTHFGNVFGSTF